MPRLTSQQWEAIRRSYEYDPDGPSFERAARRAATQLEFDAPSKQAIHQRSIAEQWKRRGMSSVIAEAHYRADSYHEDEKTHELRPFRSDDYVSHVSRSNLAFDEASDRRAEILARHRKEWTQIAGLRQEALKDRETNLPQSQARAKLAKTAAEITAIQQTGERKAWGMDDVQLPDFTDKTDEELKALASGKKTTLH